jgi:psp operon transcriptional activator
MEVLNRISEVAPLQRPVLVVGERGTGKELIAARLHFLSQRWEERFVKTNCAAIAESLIESELFGHEAGAFTGAERRRDGRFSIADGGTLFLDEIAGASLAVQEKILRAIEYGEFERVGGNETLLTDVRVIGATNIDLPSFADAGSFRHDLLDRLGFDVVTLPPLRARADDVPILAEYFARNMAAELGQPVFAGFTSQASGVLLAHQWPGNIRELKNVVERAVYRNIPGEPVADILIDPFESPYRPQSEFRGRDTVGENSGDLARPVSGNLKQAVFDLERDMIETSLAACRHNRRAAAERLGLTYSQLRHLLRRHGY